MITRIWRGEVHVLVRHDGSLVNVGDTCETDVDGPWIVHHRQDCNLVEEDEVVVDNEGAYTEAYSYRLAVDLGMEWREL